MRLLMLIENEYLFANSKSQQICTSLSPRLTRSCSGGGWVLQDVSTRLQRCSAVRVCSLGGGQVLLSMGVRIMMLCAGISNK